MAKKTVVPNVNLKADLMAQALGGNPAELAWMEDPSEKLEADAAAKKAAADPMTMLTNQIAELKGTLAGMQSAGKNLPAMPNVKVRPNLSVEPDLKGLPDPLVDGQKYGQELGQRYMVADQNRRILEQWDTNHRNEITATHDRMMGAFKKKYPDYAKSNTAIDVFAEEAAKDAETQRLDLNQYMFGNTEQFFKDIVAKMDEAGFGGKKEEEEDTVDAEVNRALGMPDGGSPAGPAGKGLASTTPVTSITSEVNKWQTQHGFHA